MPYQTMSSHQLFLGSRKTFDYIGVRPTVRVLVWTKGSPLECIFQGRQLILHPRSVDVVRISPSEEGRVSHRANLQRVEVGRRFLQRFSLNSTGINQQQKYNPLSYSRENRCLTR